MKLKYYILQSWSIMQSVSNLFFPYEKCFCIVILQNKQSEYRYMSLLESLISDRPIRFLYSYRSAANFYTTGLQSEQ